MSNALNTPNADRNNNVDDGPVTRTDPAVSDNTTTVDRREVVGREKDAFGGIKFGSCFFGWLTASGTAVLLVALVTGVGAALGLSQNVDVTNPTTAQTESIGFVGGIVLLAIIFVSYLAGGYVAGRMARFNGLKQGLGVWLWAVIMAILIAAAGWLAGARFDVFAQLNSFPRLPTERGHSHHCRCHCSNRRRCRKPHRCVARRARRDALPPPGGQGRPRSVTEGAALQMSIESGRAHRPRLRSRCSMDPSSLWQGHNSCVSWLFACVIWIL